MPEQNETYGETPAALARWLENGTPERYFRVNLKVLATELQLPFQQLLTAFVRMTHEGKFNLSWECHTHSIRTSR
ncbi:MAG: hypothetical protein OHK0011_09680 [Turneriella sp.]